MYPCHAAFRQMVKTAKDVSSHEGRQRTPGQRKREMRLMHRHHPGRTTVTQISTALHFVHFPPLIPTVSIPLTAVKLPASRPCSLLIFWTCASQVLQNQDQERLRRDMLPRHSQLSSTLSAAAHVTVKIPAKPCLGMSRRMSRRHTNLQAAPLRWSH